MSFLTLGTKLLAKVVPTVDASANCGRCVNTPLSTCCRTNYRKIALIDYCGNVCSYRCDYAPKYC
ncbi:MAG: hypothetical protein WCA46_08735 [Actinocatenispora sp.]